MVRALRGEVTEPRPIWLMRQAGRHLPGYRALRARRSLLEIVQDPDAAAEVALEPVRRYDVDAGVVFADISVPFLGLGVPFSLDPGVGPVVQRPIRTRADVNALTEFDARGSTPFVGEAITRFLAQEHDRPILGFAGGPFTMAAYLIDGRPSRDQAETKRLMYAEPATFDRLMGRLAEATIAYLRWQAESGAAALQLFDTWVGALSTSAYQRHVQEPVRAIFDGVRDLGRPTIYFATGSSHLLEQMAECGADALGVDWREPLGRVRRRVGEKVALQGNLDPAALLAPADQMRAEAGRVLAEIPDGRGHVFNLGHGVLPETDPTRVQELVELVHASADGTPA